ncbi:UreD urease accessory protein [Nitzschia inconspicua]|uniref:UreD urease accessory protein n=1 Tax=Nitzschia inconspicua TaxID=303405 RepID=A0A9K3L4G1_9STRA|nr:UreD urease accessory protein [Nitzschia inconspicua]
MGVKAAATKVAVVTTVPKLQQSLAKLVKHGVGRLTASAPTARNSILKSHSDSVPTASTRLTQVAHKAPTRLVPIGKSSIGQAGAAVCALSNYGAGMLQGDSTDLTVRVEQGAKLGVVTQGANRIYTPSKHLSNNNTEQSNSSKECRSTLTATVEKDAILIFAPDPCSLFASSSFTQTQKFYIHPHSSVALIDWFSSGRFKNHEQWAFDKLHTKTSLHWLHTNDNDNTNTIHGDNNTSSDIPFLQDATLMDLRVGRDRPTGRTAMESHAVNGYNCFASLLLYGKETHGIVKRCQELSDEFAGQHTRIREREHASPEETRRIISDDAPTSNTTPADQLGLAGRVVMGVSKVELIDNDTPSDAHVVRLAAKTNEDLYRVFYECLLAVSEQFGMQFYKERIRAHQSEIPQQSQPSLETTNVSEVTSKTDRQTNGDTTTIMTGDNQSQPKHMLSKQPSHLDTFSSPANDTAFWSMVMLADSGLPTGSFAHSAGLETAAQLGMIQSEQQVGNFVHAATRSTMQLSTPFLIAGHQIMEQQASVIDDSSASIPQQWERLHRQCHAVMSTNQPACAASLDQGKSLARILSQWLQSESTIDPRLLEAREEVLDCLKSFPPHVAPTIGAIGGLLGLDKGQVCRLYAYCAARDVVSAAVRLSLVGPLASVPMLHRAQESAEDGIQAVLSLMMKDGAIHDPLMAASASAPVIEALHPCHEVLQVRLFRS